MTTPTLTHEQAFLVRAWQLTAERLEYLRDTNVIYLDASESTPLYFNDSKAALAKYDAEWVTVRREHLEELRDAAQSAVNDHAQTFAGYPIELARMAPTEEAIAHANEVLGK